MSGQRAQYGQQSRALGYSGVTKAQQVAVGNIAAGEKQKVQQQLQALSQQIRQAQAAGDTTKVRELQNQFKVLQTRGSLLKSEIPKTAPTVGQQAMSPGAFGNMVGQLTGTPGTTASSPTAAAVTAASQPAVAPTQPTVTTSPTVNPAWRMGQPIKIGSQTLTPKDPNYKTIASQLIQQIKEQDLEEKKKPVPTNPDLWSRAKSAARSKFDVYPSAYANAWAAKWYKSKGGGWRMGKPKKK
jgi:type II secretory pathway pseudopilin PulG